jgi:hypothetical protein
MLTAIAVRLAGEPDDQMSPGSGVFDKAVLIARLRTAKARTNMS